MRKNCGVAIAYVLVIAAVMACISDAGNKVSCILFGEALFSTPMILAYFLSLIIRRTESRRIFLMFEVLFSTLTLLVFFQAFVGEHDAQYQLVLLSIPLIGFPAVVIAGVIAALSGREWPKG